jgi:hypothetical protein
MSSIQLLLSRPSAYQGLGLIATCSAVIGPLYMEVIYNHADLWFQGMWQDKAFSKVWGIWTLFGIIVSTPWGLDRGFLGITPTIHKQYCLILSAIGVCTYVTFSIPTWVWLTHMSLVNPWVVFSSIAFSTLLLIVSASTACVIEQRLNSLWGLVFGTVLGCALVYLTWGWLFQGSQV